MSKTNYGDGIIAAGDLTVDHIGHEMRWQVVDLPHQVVTYVTGEIRQIHHDGRQTMVTYGHMAELEASFDHDEPIQRFPRADMTDTDRLLRAIAYYQGDDK